MIRRTTKTWAEEMRRRRFSRAGGMSLLELTVALVIVGLLVAVVPPSLNGISAKWRLRASAQDVEAAVRRAINTAASTGSPAEIVYDLDDGSFRIRSKGETVDVRTLPSNVRFERVRFGDMELVRAAAALRAFPDGSVDAHQVHLRGPEGVFLSIAFDRLTAEAQFEEGTDASE